MVKLQNQEFTELNGDNKSTNVKIYYRKKMKETFSLEVFQLQDCQKANNWQKKLEEEIEKRENAE